MLVVDYPFTHRIYPLLMVSHFVLSTSGLNMRSQDKYTRLCRIFQAISHSRVILHFFLFKVCLGYISSCLNMIGKSFHVLVLLGLSLTHHPAPHSPFPNQADGLHADSRDTSRQVLLPSTMISGVLRPPPAESHMQPMQGMGVQDGHTDARPFPQQVEDSTPKKLTKKVRDMLRKRVQRSNDRQEFETICGILRIPKDPKNDLVLRSEYLFFFILFRRRY